MGGSDTSTPSTLTGAQIQARVEEAMMSQTTDSFEETERMSKEPLEYLGEPHDPFQGTMMLTPELDRNMEALSHFDKPEDTRARARATESIERLEPGNIWGPSLSNINRAAGENPGRPAVPTGGNPDGGGGGSGGGGGGGAPPPPAATGHGGDKLFGQPPDVFTGD